MLEHVESLTCGRCRRAFRPTLRVGCPDCTDGGELRFQYALERLSGFDRSAWSRREPWLWRYRELLPFDALVEPPPLQVGATPLYGSARLAAFAGVKALYVKDESRNPTGCTADRAAALLVAASGETMGLLSAALSESVAALGASAGRRVGALLRADEESEITRSFKAQVVHAAVELDRRAALLQACSTGLYLADSPNPLVFEGTKTLGVELADDLAERLPDWIAVDDAPGDVASAVATGVEQVRSLLGVPATTRLLAVDGESRGNAKTATSAAEREEAARAATAGLGLSISADGAAPLAGLRRAVREGQVSADAAAVVVVQGSRARGPSRGFPARDALTRIEDVVARLSALR